MGKTATQQRQLIESVAGSLKEVERQFAKLEDFIGIIQKVNKIVCEKLLPMVKQMIQANYAKMHFLPYGATRPDGKKNTYHPTHKLFEAAIDACTLIVGKKGFVVRMGPGFDKKVYVRASVFRRYRDFYKLTDDNHATLQAAYLPLFQAELDKLKVK